MTDHGDLYAHEQQHGEYLAAEGAEAIWSWGPPAVGPSTP
jgi:hypothetical protein